jgi:cytoskeletal protein CcmA (bactofilin family)
MADKQTVIGPGTRVSGELRGEEDVLVQGQIEGRVALTSVLTIEDGAIVQADVEARVVLVSGAVVGNLTATESVRLTDKARVVGDITAPRVVVEAGAAYRGRLEMGNVDVGAREARATTVRRPAESPAKAPPRVAPPSRVAAAGGAVAARVGTASPPRAASAPARTPPSLPRPEAAAAGGVASAPHPWAKKKLHRRG